MRMNVRTHLFIEWKFDPITVRNSEIAVGNSEVTVGWIVISIIEMVKRWFHPY